MESKSQSAPSEVKEKKVPKKKSSLDFDAEIRKKRKERKKVNLFFKHKQIHSLTYGRSILILYSISLEKYLCRLSSYVFKIPSKIENNSDRDSLGEMYSVPCRWFFMG